MSAPPRNASDVLMAAARAAAKKKAAVSSPKKRKSTQEKDPKPKESVKKDDDLQLNPEEKPDSESNQAAGEKKPEASSPKKQKTTKEKEVVPPKEKSPKPKPPSPKAAKKEGKTVKIDANIGQLKKKPSDFKPKSAAYWKDEEPVPFLFLARAFDLISNESGRNASTDILCNVFRTAMATTPKDLIASVYLAANKIAPSHEGIELGIGDSYIIRVLAEAYGRKKDQIKIQLEKLGDLGLVAKASRSSQRVMFPPPPLTVVKVLDTFRAIAKIVHASENDDISFVGSETKKNPIITLVQGENEVVRFSNGGTLFYLHFCDLRFSFFSFVYQSGPKAVDYIIEHAEIDFVFAQQKKVNQLRARVAFKPIL